MKVGLAPMAGVGDRAFRELCRGFGAAFTVSEMVSIKGLLYDSRNTFELLEFGELERPFGIQLFGCEPELFREAAEKVSEYNPDFIDINMGCPVAKVVKQGAGSALMTDPVLCGRIVDAVKQGTHLPVTVKIRAGFSKEQINAVEVARSCEAGGADVIAVHGRTREQMYAPSSDNGIIRKVKEAVSIPVIGNGDVTSPEDAVRMLEETGCDMVMVGRGALGNPWIFQQIGGWLGDLRQVPSPGLFERLNVMERHVRLMCVYKGEAVAYREARKHLSWYMRGLRDAAMLRGFAGKVQNEQDLRELFSKVLESNSDV